MKKAFTLVIPLVVCTFILCSCGASNNSNTSVDDASSTFDASRGISIIVREDGSGTKSAFMELVGLKGKADPEGAIMQNSTEGILAEVKENQTAIAYESLGYVTDDVKVLKVEGVEAAVANIKDGTYKLCRPLSIVYQDTVLDTPLFNAFYIFLQSKEAFEIIGGNGYITILDASAPYMIDESLSGTINISGSTSFKPLMDELVKKFEDMQPDVTVSVGEGDSGQGYSAAEDSTSEFGMISEEFNAGKAPGCVFYTVCKDGIALIVHKDNPLDSITMEDLKNIYDAEAGANAITMWNDLIR